LSPEFPGYGEDAVPTYGYRCEKCGHEFDVWQRMSDEAGAACPDCGSESRRLFFPAGIVFKGGGFYKTDSRKSGDSSSSSSSDGAAKPAKPAKSDSATSSSSSAPAAAAAD
jgi:putative FmdB family regulatory protein